LLHPPWFLCSGMPRDGTGRQSGRLLGRWLDPPASLPKENVARGCLSLPPTYGPASSLPSKGGLASKLRVRRLCLGTSSAVPPIFRFFSLGSASTSLPHLCIRHEAWRARLEVQAEAHASPHHATHCAAHLRTLAMDHGQQGSVILHTQTFRASAW
jgi:hypothetical protein